MILNIDDLGVVGIIVDDWSLDKKFKPKTLTCNPEHTAVYISRKSVPKNVKLDNNQYWKCLIKLKQGDSRIFDETFDETFI